MLDPRSLAARRDEIVESCRRRGVDADVDAAANAQEQVAALQTELNENNRRRNEHQKAGKRELSPEERRAHVAEGRRLKEEVAAIEVQLGEVQTALREHLEAIPNLVHPDSPIGGEESYRVLREVGEPPHFEFTPLDHLALGEKLDLFDFEAGAKVAGQKFYYLKNDAVLLELALQRYALDAVAAEGFTPYVTPDLARSAVVDAMAFSPRGPETQIYSIENASLDLIGTAEITLGADPARGNLPLLPDGGGLGRAREQGPLPRAPVHQGRDVRLHATGGLRSHARRDPLRPGEDLPGPGDPLPGDRGRDRRPGRAGLSEVRPRGLDAGPG
jgi:seryl-tRNA synthetase